MKKNIFKILLALLLVNFFFIEEALVSTISAPENLSINDLIKRTDLIVLAKAEKEVSAQEGKYSDTYLELHISEIFKGQELQLDLKKSITVLQKEDPQKKVDFESRDKFSRPYTGPFWNYYKTDSKSKGPTSGNSYIFFLRFSSGAYDKVNKEHFLPVGRNTIEAVDFKVKLLELLKKEF